MRVEFFIQARPSPSDAEYDLGEASWRGDAAAVSAALAAPPPPGGTRLNVDAHCDDDGATPLILAAEQGHLGVVEVLLRAGADPNKRRLHWPLDSNSGGTPLSGAAFFGHEAVVRRLIEAGADVNARRLGDSVTPLHLAAMNWHLATVRRLLAAGADVAARSCYQGTPLYLAAQGCALPEFQRDNASEQAAVLQALIDAGSEVDVRDQGELTPLHAAARAGHAAAVPVLLSAGANVEALSGGPHVPPPVLYCPALHWAAAGAHVECVRALLAGGASPAAKCRDGLTAADHVRRAGRITPQRTATLQLLAEADLRHREAGRICAVCGQTAQKTCSRCRGVRYCSAGCQTKHWKTHKRACKAPGG